MRRLSAADRRLLLAMGGGWLLKAHRHLDGSKRFQLHSPEGAAEPVGPATVQNLWRRGLIDSNKKFPAATFWLTERGRALLATLRER